MMTWETTTKPEKPSMFNYPSMLISGAAPMLHLNNPTAVRKMASPRRPGGRRTAEARERVSSAGLRLSLQPRTSKLAGCVLRLVLLNAEGWLTFSCQLAAC